MVRGPWGLWDKRGRWSAPVGHAFLLLILVSCVGPAKNFPVFESRAANSAETALSAVETVRFAIRDAFRNDAFGPYLSVTMEDAEEDVSTAQGHFASIQPPDDASDRLRTQTEDLLTRASDAVEQARIAMRRGDLDTLGKLRHTLSAVSDDLDRFISEHE